MAAEISPEKQDAIELILRALRSDINELVGAVVATTDGLPLVQVMDDGVDVLSISAMAAAALGIGKRIVTTLDSGQLSEISVKGVQGQAFFYAVGIRHVLALFSAENPNEGYINFKARTITQQIADLLND